MANRKIVWCNGRRFEREIRENSPGRYTAYAKVLDEPPRKSNSFSYSDWSAGKVEQEAREWMLRWKK